MVATEVLYTFNGIDLDDVVVATYFMEIDGNQDVMARIRQVSGLLYPGAWTDTAGVSNESRERHGIRILGLYETPPYEIELPAEPGKRRFIVQFGIPLANIGTSIATLMTAVAGEIMAFGHLKLLDLYLPRRFVSAYKGPTYGVQGLRNILNVYERPLLLAIMKPNQGFTPEQGAATFFDVASGGADIVKDDELLSNPSYCQRSKRVELYLKAEKRAYEEIGEHTLYAANITDQSDRLLQNALEAIELGANALMINYLQVGLDATRVVCEHPQITVPILGHSSGATVLHASTHVGVSSVVISGKLPRLCGVDLGIVLSGRGGFPVLPERCLLLVRELLSPFSDIQPTLPIIAAGITPGTVGYVIHEYGHDIALGAGSGVFGHPNGATAGARAFRQAIQSTLDGRTMDDASAEYPELADAISLWGTG